MKYKNLFYDLFLYFVLLFKNVNLNLAKMFLNGIYKKSAVVCPKEDT